MEGSGLPGSDRQPSMKSRYTCLGISGIDSFRTFLPAISTPLAVMSVGEQVLARRMP